MSFPGGLVVKNLPSNAGDVGLIPGSGRSPEVGNTNPLQYSCLGNPMDRGAWQAIVHGLSKSRTRLSMHAHTHVVSYSNDWTEASFLPLQPCPQTVVIFIHCFPHHYPGPCHGALSSLFLTFLPQQTFPPGSSLVLSWLW